RGQNGTPECYVDRKKTALLDKENIPESPAIDGEKNAEASETPQSYDASKLGKLEGLEAVRKKPGMYIGGTDERALHHCVSEVLDNFVDEHLAGHCDKIEVTIHVDGSISIRDNGRGIPVDIHPQYKIPGVEMVLTTSHFGGKYGQVGYKVSAGTNGIEEFVKQLNKSREPLHPKPIAFRKETREKLDDKDIEVQVEVVMQYNDSYNDQVLCYTNTIHNPDGGTHLSGFRSAVTRAIN